MIALDYIIKKEKFKQTSNRLVALINKSIEKMIFEKYIEAKYDSELLDLIVIYDLTNGVAK